MRVVSVCVVGVSWEDSTAMYLRGGKRKERVEKEKKRKTNFTAEWEDSTAMYLRVG